MDMSASLHRISYSNDHGHVLWMVNTDRSHCFWHHLSGFDIQLVEKAARLGDVGVFCHLDSFYDMGHRNTLTPCCRAALAAIRR